MTHDVRWTPPRVWHKLPTGELKIETTILSTITIYFLVIIWLGDGTYINIAALLYILTT